MISKSQIKLITSLHQKKYRNKEGLFIAEGPKVIQELLKEGLILYSHFSTLDDESSAQITKISEANLQKISCLTTANSSLAVFEMPIRKPMKKVGLTVVLDAVRDPGNLGTIIRLCDWFGVSQLLCSMDTVDCYNPKVIQATMGSIARLSVQYLDVEDYLKHIDTPIYTAMMDGDNVYKTKLPKDAVLVMGNEANGVSTAIQKLATHALAIPQFGTIQATESLNVATATAILLSEFSRVIEK